MTIFQQLVTELSAALVNYQTEKQARNETISTIRQKNIIDLQQLLDDSQQESSAPLLRLKVLDYIQQHLAETWLATIMPFWSGSHLRQCIQAVLNKPEFTEQALIIQEGIELRHRQQLIGTSQNGEDLLDKLDALTEDIQSKSLQAKLAMTLSDQLRTQCEKLTLESQDLITANKQLRLELQTLQQNAKQQITTLQTQINEQKKLIDQLNQANQQLRLDKEVERTTSLKIQRKLDSITPKYFNALETIQNLHAFLKHKGIDEAELNSFVTESLPQTPVNNANSCHYSARSDDTTMPFPFECSV